MERIESGANEKIKFVARLHQRKYRDKEGCFVVEGIRFAEMAAASTWTPTLALVTSEAAKKPRVECVLTHLLTRGCSVYEVPATLYQKAAATVTPQGLLVVMARRQTMLKDLTAGDPALWVVLDGVQDPGNAGMILRTADAAGATAVIALEDTVDLFSDKALRASMGSIFHLPVVTHVSPATWISFAARQGMKIFAAALARSASLYFSADYRAAAAVVFGREGSGVSQDILSAAQPIYIPMLGQAESLNVSAAAAVILYEALRQRHEEDTAFLRRE